jgi:hypothetical protein
MGAKEGMGIERGNGPALSRGRDVVFADPHGYGDGLPLECVVARGGAPGPERTPAGYSLDMRRTCCLAW